MKSPLINVQQLKDLSINHNIILLDATIDKVGEKLDNNTMSLIPNSIFFDIEGLFSDHSSGLPHTMIDPISFTTHVQNLGINQDSIVVIYDRWGIYSSPRAWWMFRYMGHEQAYVLDGGIKAWLSKDFPISDKHHTSTEQGDFRAVAQKDWFKNKSDILQHLQSKTSSIIDARGSGRFYGTAADPRPGVRSGHIPTSSNLPFDQVLDGVFLKDKTLLKPIFASHLREGGSNIFTCGSGITASILALAAYQIGVTNLAVYDGSWAEWGADHSLPME
ncbi:sulfurtransferase [Sphingobacterium luzhongxinii]|uniref:sulfurtransferase n=1 Tax=Sphingobacterium luzhongxinii TaxID=2654181 RepID=UPI0013DC9E8E|nr:sulfurtransferase [Sphingobacterium sp. xlx-73]